MQAELYTKIETDEFDRERIKDAISTMKDVASVYEKTGLASVIFLVEDLNDGISALMGVLEGLYY